MKNACVSYGLKYQKGEFDHSKMKNWNDVEKYKSEVEPYLKLDVLSLKELICKFQSSLSSEDIRVDARFGKKLLMNFIKNHTTGIDKETDINKIKENLIFIPDEKLYDFQRQSIFGGRCYPKQKYFESNMYDEIIKSDVETRKGLYKKLYESNDYVFAADIVSMYPTSMCGIRGLLDVEYPLGQAYVSNEPEIEFNNGKLGFFEIEFECPKN